MAATQQIFRIRRQYNQWVNNQTLEDYALRFTAKKARRWSIARVAMTALGTTAFLALEALGAAVTLEYGFTNAVLAMAVVCGLIFLMGLPICIYAARYGVDIDLLTRGAGFGYLGSTITSLVYATFTFIFFAIEAAIMAVALQALFGIPLQLAYVICAVVVIPIVTHGFTFISRFQIGTQYLWLALQIAALVLVAMQDYQTMDEWMNFGGAEAQTTQFNLLAFGAAAAILIALVAQLGEQVDYLRFMPEQTEQNKGRWYAAVIMAGPGWVGIGFIKLLFGSFLAVVALQGGASAEIAADPTAMYQRAYSYFMNAPHMALVLAGIMVVISQMKINVTNAYAGSIAWSNFFSRLTHSHPGRVVWLVFNVVIALLLMELGIYRVLENILGVFAIVAVAWLGTLAADLSINKKLGFSPEHIEFKRAHLYDINPVGVGSMIIASVIGILAYLEHFGPEAKALAHFITLGCCFVCTPVIAWWTRGRFYLARSSDELIATRELHECCICENEFEREDTAYCTAYSGAICSLCCSLDARCMDSCKPEARLSQQLHNLLGRFVPGVVVESLFSRTGRFISIFAITSALNAGLLSLVYFEMAARTGQNQLIADTLTSIYFILTIIAGVLIWLFLLANESRLVAQQESDRQTRRLLEEIEAHNQTDLELQRAKESAEAANHAKSRYLSGISHEFRTPLQSILGYAQLMKKDQELPNPRRKAVEVIHRSGEHLADLIEGLLDVSRIEAGRIEIRREVVNLHELLAQLIQIFSPEAAAKNITFKVSVDSNLPKFVKTDEKRLRQILTNLLSNAVKFTQKGGVEFNVRYRSQVAEFRVTDTGSGIAEEDMESIFKPFERIRKPNAPVVAGTGLGLTIVNLLTDIMGGDINVVSAEGEGSCFTLSMMLSSVAANTLADPEQPTISGYRGPRKTVMVVDDDPVHRGLMIDMLTPLGFQVTEARDAENCLRLVDEASADLFLLDISMPGVSGLDLAGLLRQRGIGEPIIMISANAQEQPPEGRAPLDYNAYMIKPIRFTTLLDRITQVLDIEWTLAENTGNHRKADNSNLFELPELASETSLPPLDAEVCARLTQHAEIGYARGLQNDLDHFCSEGRIPPELAEKIRTQLGRVEFAQIIGLLERCRTSA